MSDDARENEKNEGEAGVEPTSAASSSSATANAARTRAFIAGATSFTGRALALQDAEAFGVDARLQVRPGSSNRKKLQGDPRIVDIDVPDKGDLEGRAALAKAIDETDAVVQLIGTVRARFDADGDYETVDFGTTQTLVQAAKANGRRPHFVLLSSIGAGTGLGAYLDWKKKTEALVIESGLPYTILRPSMLAGDDVFTERPAAANSSAFLAGLSDTPFGAPFALVRPINIQVLARIILHVVGKRGPRDEVLRGQSLFKIARANDLM